MVRQPSSRARARSGETSRGGTKYAPTRRVCSFCADKVKIIDYKNPEKLRAYISDRAKIISRHRTGTCAKHQRLLARAIKRARYLALLPYVSGHIRKMAAAS